MSLGAGLVKQKAENARGIEYRVLVSTRKDTRSRTKEWRTGLSSSHGQIN